MKVYKNLIFAINLLCSPALLAANASINELNSCVALVDFVDAKLDNFASHHAVEDMAVVHSGLSAYKDFLQNDVITPKLLSMYGGNEAQAKLMQKLLIAKERLFLSILVSVTQKKNSSQNMPQLLMIVRQILGLDLTLLSHCTQHLIR